MAVVITVAVGGGNYAALRCLLRNMRKTECGANLFLTPLGVRAAPFELLLDRPEAFEGILSKPDRPRMPPRLSHRGR